MTNGPVPTPSVAAPQAAVDEVAFAALVAGRGPDATPNLVVPRGFVGPQGAMHGLQRPRDVVAGALLGRAEAPDPEWLRLVCPNYVAAEAKWREAAERQTVRGAPYIELSAVAKCAGVLAGR